MDIGSGCGLRSFGLMLLGLALLAVRSLRVTVR
jgi:hypothetical protein